MGVGVGKYDRLCRLDLVREIPQVLRSDGILQLREYRQLEMPDVALIRIAQLGHHPREVRRVPFAPFDEQQKPAHPVVVGFESADQLEAADSPLRHERKQEAPLSRYVRGQTLDEPSERLYPIDVGIADLIKLLLELIMTKTK